MLDLDLRDPWFLAAALAAPLVYWLASRRVSFLTFSSLASAPSEATSWRARLARAPALLLAGAALLLAIAFAGPRTGDATTAVHREGIAMILVIDRSGSMEARDFVEGDVGVSRLDAVKEIVRRFVLGGEGLGGRPDDLIGMVQFARYADATCPLTLDHLNLAAILDQIEIAREPAEDGTAVGEGLALGVERLRRHPAKSKVIVLLTDGVNNAGEIDPLHAAELAAAHDIRVYAVGAGQTGLAPVPVQAPDGRVFLRRAHVELDEKTLRAIAQRADGRYFHARNSEMLSDVYAEIDRLERTRVSEVRYMQYREHYAGWTLGALACVAVAGLAAATILRRLP